jgi:hypothetical protein
VEGREVAGRSGALNALKYVFHVPVDVLPELQQHR